MPRYIDADKLKERLMVGSELDPEPCKGFRSALLAMVDSQEDADVVEVVRCKECKWQRKQLLPSGHYWYECRYGIEALGLDREFCSDGERRTDDA